MPNVAILPWTQPRVGPIIGIVDGWPEEHHTLKTTVGGAPIEDGTRVTDHAVVRTEEVTLTGFVSDWRGAYRAPAAWAALRRLHAALVPVRVITEWGVYPSMLITELDAPKRLRGLRFTMKLQWQIIVGITDNELPSDQTSGPAAQRGGNVDRGRVAVPAAS